MKLNSKKENLIFYTFPITLFSLIPIFLITGPFLSDLSISLIGLIFLIYCFQKKNFSYFKNQYFFFFLVFWFYLLFNSLINNFNLDSIKISFFYIRYGIFVIAVAALLNFNHKFLKYFFYIIFICFSVLILHGFYQYFFAENGPRVSSFFGNEKILGSYLIRLMPIFFGLSIFILKKKKFILLFALVFILSEVLIFLSGDRSAFFYLNLSAFFFLSLSKILAKIILLILISSFLLIVIISFINPTAKTRLVDRTLDQMNLLKNKNDVSYYIFSVEHTHHYITAYRMFLDNKVLGVGVKNFRNFCSDEKYKVSQFSCSTHPHGTYIQILAETGIIGFLFLITILFYFCRYVFRHLLLRFKGKYFFSDFQICILSGVAIYLWPFIPTGNVFNNWLNIMMILNLPFLIFKKNKIMY